MYSLIKTTPTNYTQLVDSHHKYLNTLNNSDILQIVRYVQGKYMNKSINLSDSILQYIINNSPKLTSSISILRAHLFSSLPKVGSIIHWKRPMSFSMFHPFVLEWLLFRPSFSSYRCIILLDLPVGFNNCLCISKASPFLPNSVHFQTFLNKFKSIWRNTKFSKYNKQLENQSEIILGFDSLLYVSKIHKFNTSSVNNVHLFGTGWFPLFINNKSSLYIIHCKIKSNFHSSIIYRTPSCIDYNIKQLRKLAKQQNLSHYSKLSKLQLCKLLRLV